MPDLVQKFSDLRIEKGYAYLRWLMLIATGAFSVSISILFSRQHPVNSLLILKSALSSNAVGILFGAISLYGEAMLPNGAFRLLAQREIYKLQGNHAEASNMPEFYVLPSIMKYFERICYLSLSAALCLWVCFIWQQ